MERTITVEIKSQYGANVIHPICKDAKAFAAIAGTKTLTPAAVQSIKALGYQINVQQPVFKL